MIRRIDVNVLPAVFVALRSKGAVFLNAQGQRQIDQVPWWSFGTLSLINSLDGEFVHEQNIPVH